jgi:hypothetical protein
MDLLLDRRGLVVSQMLHVLLHAKSVCLPGILMCIDRSSGSARPAFSWGFVPFRVRIVCCMGSVWSMRAKE